MFQGDRRSLFSHRPQVRPHVAGPVSALGDLGLHVSWQKKRLQEVLSAGATGLDSKATVLM